MIKWVSNASFRLQISAQWWSNLETWGVGNINEHWVLQIVDVSCETCHSGRQLILLLLGPLMRPQQKDRHIRVSDAIIIQHVLCVFRDMSRQEFQTPRNIWSDTVRHIYLERHKYNMVWCWHRRQWQRDSEILCKHACMAMCVRNDFVRVFTRVPICIPMGFVPRLLQTSRCNCTSYWWNDNPISTGNMLRFPHSHNHPPPLVMNKVLPMRTLHQTAQVPWGLVSRRTDGQRQTQKQNYTDV